MVHDDPRMLGPHSLLGGENYQGGSGARAGGPSATCREIQIDAPASCPMRRVGLAGIPLLPEEATPTPDNDVRLTVTSKGVWSNFEPGSK